MERPHKSDRESRHFGRDGRNILDGVRGSRGGSVKEDGVTRNQKHALRLAESILNRQVDPTHLSDEDWQLLLLASGTSYLRTKASVLCQRVIDDYLNCGGYFSNCDRRHLAERNGQPGWHEISNPHRLAN
jgi:hypothetical protein